MRYVVHYRKDLTTYTWLEEIHVLYRNSFRAPVIQKLHKFHDGTTEKMPLHPVLFCWNYDCYSFTENVTAYITPICHTSISTLCIKLRNRRCMTYQVNAEKTQTLHRSLKVFLKICTDPHLCLTRYTVTHKAVDKCT